MRIDRIAAVAASSLLVGSCPASIKNNNASNKDVIKLRRFLNRNKHEHSLCSSIGLMFKLWHEDSYDREIWKTVLGQFLDLIMACKGSEKNPDDTKWLDMLGSPFKDLAEYRNYRGIHGTLTVFADDDLNTIQLKATVYHDEDYDEEAWKSVMEKAIEFADKSVASNDVAEGLMATLGPLLKDAISVAGDESGIHGGLEMKWHDKDNHEIMYSA